MHTKKTIIEQVKKLYGKTEFFYISGVYRQNENGIYGKGWKSCFNPVTDSFIDKMIATGVTLVNIRIELKGGDVYCPDFRIA